MGNYFVTITVIYYVVVLVVASLFSEVENLVSDIPVDNAIDFITDSGVVIGVVPSTEEVMVVSTEMKRLVGTGTSSIGDGEVYDSWNRTEGKVLGKGNHVVSAWDNVVYDENGNCMVSVLDCVRNVDDEVLDDDVLYDRSKKKDVKDIKRDTKR